MKSFKSPLHVVLSINADAALLFLFNLSCFSTSFFFFFCFSLRLLAGITAEYTLWKKKKKKKKKEIPLLTSSCSLPLAGRSWHVGSWWATGAISLGETPLVDTIPFFVVFFFFSLHEEKWTSGSHRRRCHNCIHACLINPQKKKLSKI